MHVLVLLFAILFLPSISVSFPKPAMPLNGISIDLIHRDSPLSPFYNSSMTASERNRNAVLRSLSRANHFHISLNKYRAELAETIIFPSRVGGDYIMRYYIGTPPVETYAFADTGSDLIWVQCETCESCYPQTGPIFNPKSSSTFKGVSCESKSCSLIGQAHGQSGCGKSNECSYSLSYADGAYTRGEVAMDFINLIPNKGGQSVSFPKSVFGCGHNNGGNPSEIAGVVGLGGGPLSLVSQLSSQFGSKFSYCLLPTSSTSYSKLKFGEDAVISGQKGVVSTPLLPFLPAPTFYIVNLEGITVGKKTVKNVQSGRKSNIVIDSGSTRTYLLSSLYNQFVDLIKEAIGVQAVQNPPTPYNLCYRSNTNLPDAVFHFTNADVVLKPVNLFADVYPNLVCLEMGPTDTVPQYGNVAQINFEVEYDLDKKMVYFAPADCTKV